MHGIRPWIGAAPPHHAAAQRLRMPAVKPPEMEEGPLFPKNNSAPKMEGGVPSVFFTSSVQPGLITPRTTTIPAVIAVLVLVLLGEATVMGWISQPDEVESGYRDERYTVEYRDCWVIERANEAAAALRIQAALPVRIMGHPWQQFMHKPPTSCRATREAWHLMNGANSHFSTAYFKDVAQFMGVASSLAPRSSTHEMRDLIGGLRRQVQQVADAQEEPGAGGASASAGAGAGASAGVVGAGSTAAALEALRELESDLAHARAAAYGVEASLILGRIADPIHDRVWPRLCPESNCTPAAACVAEKPWTPQGCWPWKDQLLGRLIHLIFTYVNIGLCLVVMVSSLVFRGAFMAEYTLIHRLIGSLCLLRLLRICTFGATALPMINLSCRPRFKSVTNGGGCGDFLFSGHGSIIAISLLLFWGQWRARAPRWPLLLLIPLSLCLVLVSVGYALERWHYSIDVFMAYATALPVWRLSHVLWGDETVGDAFERYLYIPPILGRTLRLQPVHGSGSSSGHSTDAYVTPAEPLEPKGSDKQRARYRIGPIGPIALAGAIGVCSWLGSMTRNIGTAKQDPVFGALQGMAISVVVICLSVTEHKRPGQLVVGQGCQLSVGERAQAIGVLVVLLVVIAACTWIDDPEDWPEPWKSLAAILLSSS